MRPSGVFGSRFKMRMTGAGQFAAIVAIVGLPAAGVNIAHRITGNPFLNPLGITQESIANFGGPTEFVAIGVYVDWGIDRSERMTQIQLRDYISNAMSSHTSDFFIRFQEVPGTDIGITLVVGPNRYGPYTPSRLMEGIVPASVALELTRASRG